MRKRSHRLDKMARVYDDEILPIWSERFGRMLLKGLKVPNKAMVLDVATGTGYPALEIIKLMDTQSRLVAIEGIGVLLDVARKKAGDLAAKRIFFRTENPEAKLGFADGVYDLTVSNLGLLEVDNPQKTLQDFARVTKPGGQVVVTLPLAGTFSELHDIFREVLVKGDKHETLVRLEEHISQTPGPDEAACWLENAGLQDVEVEVDEFKLLFRSSREFFFAPVIEYGPLVGWKRAAGKGEGMQELFWQIKEAIDIYFGDKAFEITVKAGCLRGRRPGSLKVRQPQPPREQSQVVEALQEVTRSGIISEGSSSFREVSGIVLLPDEDVVEIEDDDDQGEAANNSDDEVTRPRG
ncbi:MAG: class I SAM-dependent methyltransferase [Deltaproteobacteria bacterium]|nr:class I SAM-dependent methyltransferase [Deltaproteobacteria bacterium]